MRQTLTVKVCSKNKKLDDFLKKTKKELDLFFDSVVSEPAVFLLDSRKELDVIWKQKTERWVVGGTKYGAIFILNPDHYVKESDHKNKNDFWKTLKHEYCHIYFRSITSNTRPLWLHEGLATYLAEQKKTCDNPLDIFCYFDKQGKGLYDVGYFWVDLLIKKFGKAKLVKLIKSLNVKSVLTEKEFSKIFFKIYGFKFDKKTLIEIMKQ